MNSSTGNPSNSSTDDGKGRREPCLEGGSQPVVPQQPVKGSQTVVPQHTVTENDSPSPSPEPETPTLPNARIVRGYRLLESLGGGAYGVVYRALSPGGFTVAVKEVRYAIDHPQAKREIDALELIKSLRHPFLLAIHDCWVENDRLYIAMEMADCTLTQFAAQRQPEGIPQEELVRIFEEAAAALDDLHENRILHRDIKPANILLLKGHAKVADLGLAKFNPSEVATSMNVAGTPAYMPPEMFANEFRAESDQYALALCYAEIRLGRRLCEGTNLHTALFWHISGVRNLTGLEPHEQKAVDKALSKEPTARFPSCRDFVRALHRPKLPMGPPPPPVTNQVWKVAIPALLVVLLVAALIWRLLPPTPTPPPALPVAYAPAEHGFLVPANAKIIEVGDKRYYDRMAKMVGVEEVIFLLIPRVEGNDPQTFYMMQNKVSNGLFKVAASDSRFQELLEEQKKDFTKLKWEEWKFGGKRNGNEDVGDGDALPVLRVNVLEAYCFARWLGGNLPLEQQWDAAAGKYRGAKTPIRDPETPLQPGDVAINRNAEGPREVGTAARDVSLFECRDMAGNGQEWTRNLAGGGLIPPDRFSPLLLVNVRGQRYYNSQPFRFDLEPDAVKFTISDPAVGFRVVVEP